MHAPLFRSLPLLMFTIARHHLKNIFSLDWMLMLALFGILLFGFTALYSIGLGRENQLFLERQITALIIGSSIAIILAGINYRMLKNAAIPVYIGACIILVMVLLFGEKIRGTRGWFFFGEFGFQPAEFAKLALILVLARYFSYWTRQLNRLRPIIISGLLTAIPTMLILFQPDFGSALIVFGIWFSVILASGIPKRYYVAFFALLAILFLGAWLFLFQDYQKDRIRSFVFPNRDASGIGYNVRQALIAVGGGQLTGQGIGAGSQSQLRFLPESQTDFIFAVIAEELGFVGITALLLFFLLFFYRMIRILRNAQDDFAAFIVCGSCAVLFLETAINIGGNLGLIPLTGIVLPFVSYGGSALVFSLSLIGLVQSVKIHSS